MYSYQYIANTKIEELDLKTISIFSFVVQKQLWGKMDEEENPTEDRLVAGGGKKRSSVVEGIII